MKRMRAALAVLMGLLVLLSGCGDSGNTPTTLDTVPADSQPQEQISPIEVDRNVVYFSNQLEYGRLYSIRTDGTQLKPIADVYSYNVQQIEDSVYFMANGDVCAYHIPTGTISEMVHNAFDYSVDGDHLVYFRDSEEDFLSEVRHYDLRTGEDMLIEEINFGGNCSAADGRVYYNRYDMAEDKSYLCMCNLQTLQVHIIGADLNSYYRLQAVEEGLYFEGADENYDFGHYYASADGSGIRKLDVAFTDACQMFCISGDVALCTHTDYAENGTIASVHRHNPDGTVTQFMQSKEAGYFHTTPLRQDLWLLEYTDYGGWSTEEMAEEDEYFVFLYEYYLIDADGNLTPIDVTGELGRMFESGDFPVMDSSTARKPVTASLYTAFVAGFGYDGAKPLCSTTHGAWLNIADRKADIALLAAPTEEEMAYLNERGVSIEMKLYGGDGLVFIGNSANPVQNLTHEQLVAIYQGKITNWSEVGGPDHPITVYYRDDQSGSQRLFEKMVFKGLELPNYEALGFAYMDDMSTIVEIVMADPYSIGYSIMTYLDDVYGNDSVKVFSVDGVTPSVDTVKDSTYRYHTQGYVVIRSDEAEGSPARRLFDWFGSPVSDEILIANGITPLHGETGIG